MLHHVNIHHLVRIQVDFQSEWERRSDPCPEPIRCDMSKSWCGKEQCPPLNKQRLDHKDSIRSKDCDIVHWCKLFRMDNPHQQYSPVRQDPELDLVWEYIEPMDLPHIREDKSKTLGGWWFGKWQWVHKHCPKDKDQNIDFGNILSWYRNHYWHNIQLEIRHNI